MNHIKKDISDGLQEEGVGEFNITAEEVLAATELIKTKKMDGDKGLCSNNIIHAPHSMYEHISKMLTSMCVHGTTPEDLLTSTIISVPKDSMGDLSDSQNYRGIALTSCLNKIYDHIIILKYGHTLHTSDLQFSFKEKHSTVMCNLSLKEIIQYYNNRGSKVYCCMLDASKAFDRLRYDKLFALLMERGLPLIIIRQLIDSYERQMARTKWSLGMSAYFHVTNGIRQGGVVSPLLYTVYADELLKRLQCAGIGCHIGHMYAGTLCYADDTALLCPSIKGLQKMLDICEEFGKEYDVLFNERKTACICFARDHQMKEFHVTLNGHVLNCETSVKHLGIITSFNLDDALDINAKRGDLIGRCNHILNKYKSFTSDVQSHMIETYCTHLYGCETWRYKSKHIRNIFTTWHVALRKAWDLPPMSHRFFLPGLANTEHISVKVYRRFMRLFKSMQASHNKVVQLIAVNALSDPRSYINGNIQHISMEMDIPFELLVNGAVGMLKTSFSEEQLQTISLLTEIKFCLEGREDVPGFSTEERADIYATASVI